MDVNDPLDPIDPSGLQRFLATSDLEELAIIRDNLDARLLDMDDRLEIEAVLHDWDDIQAIANLLMYPELIAADERIAHVRRALVDNHTYLQLAATVAIIEIDRAEFGEDTRFDFVQKLLDLIGSDRGVVADRASYAMVALMHPTDGPDVIARLDHPSATVRRNLTQGLLGLVGPSGVKSLVDEPGFVEPAVQAAVRTRLRDDGIELARPTEDLRQPLILVYLPSYSDWEQ